MTNAIPVFLGLCLCLFMGFTAPEKTKLAVEITNYEPNPNAKIRVSVFTEKDFLEQSIQTKSVVPSAGKVIVEFELPPGEYAVSTYQDVNSNNKLDRYIIGKPKEPYGFSNNVKPFGPPKFKDCKFTLPNGPKNIQIKLIN
jgi:uncharacterized protein (DUF2141 family)